MSTILSDNLYYNLNKKTRLSYIEGTAELDENSLVSFYNDKLIELRTDNKLYIYEDYSMREYGYIAYIDVLEDDLKDHKTLNMKVNNNSLIISTNKGYFIMNIENINEHVVNPSNDFTYPYDYFRMDEELDYRPFSINRNKLIIKNTRSSLQIRNLNDNVLNSKLEFKSIIEGFDLISTNEIAISFYNEPYYLHVYDLKAKEIQKMRINENINGYEYDIQHQITRIYNHPKTNELYYSTRSGRLFKSDVVGNKIKTVSERFYQFGSMIDSIEGFDDYIVTIDRNNRVLFYNTVYNRKEIVEIPNTIRSIALSSFLAVIVPRDIDKVDKLVLYNPPSISILTEKLEYRFDNASDPTVYINLSVKLSENEINNFDNSRYRVKLNVINSEGEYEYENSDVKIYNRQGTKSNMYIRLGKKSEIIDSGYLLKMLNNADFLYQFTVDNIDNYTTFTIKEYPDESSDLYRHITDTEVFETELPIKDHIDGFNDSQKMKDVFHNGDNEYLISLMSNLVNENIIYPNNTLKIDSKDMRLDYPDYDPRRYIDISNEYPSGQKNTDVINSDVYFNGYKVFKNDILQKDNFDGSINVYVNHLALKPYMHPLAYEYMIKNKKLTANDTIIVSNKSKSLYESEKLLFKHVIDNTYENQTSLLPTKGILLPNTRLSGLKIQNIRVYVKVFKEDNSYYHRLNPKNFNLWIDEEYKLLRVAIYGMQVPEGSELMVMDNGYTNNMIQYNNLNYIKSDIDCLPIVEIGPSGELLTELDRRTEDTEVIVDGLTLIPNRDYYVMNTPNDLEIPSLVVFRNTIPNTAKVEISLFNDNSMDTYYFKEPAIGTGDVFVIPDDKRLFTNNVIFDDPFIKYNVLKDSNVKVSNDNLEIAKYEMMDYFEKDVDYVLTLKGSIGTTNDYIKICNTTEEFELARIKHSDYDSTTGTYQITFKGKVLDSENTHLSIYNSNSEETVSIDWIKLKKGVRSTRAWEPFPSEKEFSNKPTNFEIFVNNKKIPNNNAVILNSRAIRIKRPPNNGKLINVMIRFNFSHVNTLQRIMDNYKYKNINVNEDRNHDERSEYITSEFDVITHFKPSKSLGNLQLINLIDSGKNILDCNKQDLPFDIRLGTDVIYNTYIKRNIDLDMNRLNIKPTINKVSDMVNEILDINNINENLILNSNNPSLYISTGKNILNDSLNSKMMPNSSGFGLATQNKDLSWTIESDPDKEVSVYYYLRHKSSINRTSRDMELNNWYTISMDIITDNDTTIEFGIKSKGIINYYSPNESYLYYDIQKNNRQRIHYIFKWIDDQIINDIPFIVRTFGKNSKNTIVTYDKMKFSEGINIDDQYTTEERLKHYSEYPFSKKDKYNSDFELQSNIRDIKLKNDEINLGFDLDTSLYESDKSYTLSFYARNKNNSNLRFVNEDLDIDIEIKNNEFKRYTKYLYLSSEMDIDKVMGKFKFISEDDIYMDLFGFKLEKGLKVTKYNPNIKDLQGGDKISNVVNVNFKDNTNLLDVVKDDYKLNSINFDTDSNNLINNSNFDLINNPNHYPLATVPTLQGGRQYTLSADIEYRNANPGSQNRVGIEIKMTFEDGSTGFRSLWRNLKGDNDNYKGRMSSTFKTEMKRIKTVTSVILYTSLIEADYVRISNPQLEEGSEATPYKPSLDDIKKANKVELDKIVNISDIKSKNVYNIKDFGSLNNYLYYDFDKAHGYEGPEGINDTVWKMKKIDENATPPIYPYEYNTQMVPIKPNEVYTASVYVKVSPDMPDNQRIRIIWYDYEETDSSLKTKVSSELTPDNLREWTRLSVTFKNTENKTFEKITPLFYAARTTIGETYFTGFQIEKSSYVTSWEPNLENKIRNAEIEGLNILKNTNTEVYIPTTSLDTRNIENNQFYTFSMDVKIDSITDTSTKSLYGGFKLKDGSYSSAMNVYYIPRYDKENLFRAFFIMYIRDIDSIDSFVFRAGYSPEQSMKNAMTFSRIKMEKGKVATAYSKAANSIENVYLDPEI